MSGMLIEGHSFTTEMPQATAILWWDLSLPHWAGLVSAPVLGLRAEWLGKLLAEMCTTMWI